MFNKSNNKSPYIRGVILAVLLTMFASPAAAVTYDLVAKEFVDPNTGATMWGYALQGGAETPSVPGPRITVPVGDPTLTINLRNDLPVPTSMGIAGQKNSVAPAPVLFDDGTFYADGVTPRMRIRSFDKETAPTATVAYTWTDVQPGTYLYGSVSHIQVQRQMGLYGAMTKDFGANEAYPGVTYDVDQILVYSEVDPILHEEMDDDNLLNGSHPTDPMTSTINYNPKYYLLNGAHRPYAPSTDADALNISADVNQKVLLRMVNAGLRTVAPNVLGARCDVIAEDGNQYKYDATAHPRSQYSVGLWAGATKDCLLTPSAAGVLPIVERRTTGLADGGQLAFVTVGAVVGVPVADNDSYPGAIEDTVLVIAAPGVLVNDSDSDSLPAPLTANLVSDASNGSVALALDGSFTYTPNADFNGGDSFTYQAFDGANNSNLATVNISVSAVNDPPSAAADAFDVALGVTTTIDAPGVLDNDSDVDGDTITPVIDTDVTGGVLTLRTDGSFDYEPTTATPLTGDSFTYHVNDGALDSATVTVDITITDVNVAPVAVDDFRVVTQRKKNSPPANYPVNIDVLANDSDPNGNLVPASVAIEVSGSAGGELTLVGDGTVDYTPALNFRGTETFIYSVSDSDGLSSAATVTINVVK